MFANVSKGLKYMFLAAVCSIICAIISIIPIIGVIGTLGIIACGVVSIIGIYFVSTSLEDAKPALIFIIAKVVANILGSFFLKGFFGILVTVFDILVVFYIVKATSAELGKNGKVELEQKGNSVWKLYLAIGIVEVVLTLLGYIPIIKILAAVISVIVGIASIVLTIIYLIYLNSASKAFAEL